MVDGEEVEDIDNIPGSYCRQGGWRQRVLLANQNRENILNE